MIEFSLIHVVSLIIVFIAAVAVETRKGLSSRVVLRVLAVLLILLSFYGLLFPPVFTKNAPEKDIVFANNFERGLPDSLNQSSSLKIDRFTDYLSLKDSLNIKKLTIIGNGLASWELENIDSEFNFIPVTSAKGIYQLSYPESIFESTPFQIKGKLRHTDSVALSVYFEDQTIDSIFIPPGRDDFKLNATIGISGYHTLTFLAVSNQDTMMTEKLGIKVERKNLPSVLVMTSQPDFEQKYLINYLENNGMQIAIRQKLGPDIYHREYINRKSISLNTLNDKLLKDIDLLISDPFQLNSFSVGERSQLLEYLSSGELNLLLLGNPAAVNQNILDVSIISETTELWDTDAKRLKTKHYRYDFKKNPSKEIKYREKIIGYSEERNLGKVIIPALENTYKFTLVGSSEEYEAIWSRLFNSFNLYIFEGNYFNKDVLPLVNTPVSIDLYSVDADPKLIIDDKEWPLKESPYRPGLYSTIFWPDSSGWLKVTGSVNEYLYVYAIENWKELRAEKNKKATEAYNINSSLQNNVVKTNYTIPKWIFYTFILVLLGYIWLDEKRQ